MSLIYDIHLIINRISFKISIFDDIIVHGIRDTPHTHKIVLKVYNRLLHELLRGLYGTASHTAGKQGVQH